MMDTNSVQSIINCENPEEADAVLLAVPYDETSSFGKGANKGPGAIKECLDRQIELHHPGTNSTPVDQLKIAWEEVCMLEATVCPTGTDTLPVSPEEMVARVAAAYRRNLARSQFTILLGGEHSVSVGAFRALADMYGPNTITVVQIDAHFDLRETDSDFADQPHGPFAHCCVMRHAAEMGFPIISVGIRAYSKEELDCANRLASDGKLKYFLWEPSSERRSHCDVIESVRGRHVYLTLDVDGIDPAHMPATGTPVQGGLDWNYTRNLLRALFNHSEVIGADIVEVAPRQHDALTEYGAAQLCYDIIAYHLLSGKKRP